MFCQRVVIILLMVLTLGYGFDWYLVNWQWWAVTVPFFIVMTIAEAIEQEIRGWH